MTSPLDAPFGAREPRFRTVPQYASTSGHEAIELAEMAGLHLDPWQQDVLIAMLGEQADGRFAAFQVGVVMPRQNGKGAILEARELAGLFLLGERLIIHSAHEAKTANEAFRRLESLIMGCPDLKKRVAPVGGFSHGAGREAIKLKNGARCLFQPRTTGGGKGMSADCVVLDEAQIIAEQFTGALIPTLSARPNPQVIYTANAVDQQNNAHGLPLSRLREQAVSGESNALVYFEWSVPGLIADVTPDLARDPKNWALANPALGTRITAEYVANEQASAMGPRQFAVERLGIGDWPRTDGLGDQVIVRADWEACEDPTSKPEYPVCFAVDVTPDRSMASIAVCGDRRDGKPHVEVVDHRRGTAWVVARAAELMRRHKTYQLLLDPGGPAGSLLPELLEIGGKDPKGDPIVQPVTAREHAQGCGIFFDAVAEDRLRHLGQDELDAAVEAARKRSAGEAWLWDRRGSTDDISPLVACTLALLGNSRRPKRKARVVNLNAID